MTLYAGNSLMGAIYKGSELICKTGGATADMIAVGNQLRRAEAYEYSEDVSGTYYIVCAYLNNYYCRFGPYTSKPKVGGKSGGSNSISMIIDGKLYCWKNAGELSQKGTASNWKFFKSSNLVFNTSGKMYYLSQGGTPSAISNGPTITDENTTRYVFPKYSDKENPGAIIDNGTLYVYTTTYVSSPYTSTGSTGWTELCYADNRGCWGIRNGYLSCCYTASNNLILDTDIRPHLMTPTSSLTDVRVVSESNKKQVLRVALNTSTKEITTSIVGNYYTSDIVKLNNQVVFCADGSVYDIGTSYTPRLMLANVSDISDNGYGCYFCIKDNKLYAVYNSNSYLMCDDLSFSEICDERLDCLFKVAPGTIYRDCYYGVNNPSTLYHDPRISEKTNYSSKTSTTVTVNNKVYTRNQSKDSSFKFIPDELRTRTFTDADVLDACLSAGLDLNS